jgi:hypothetical protein
MQALSGNGPGVCTLTVSAHDYTVRTTPQPQTQPQPATLKSKASRSFGCVDVMLVPPQGDSEDISTRSLLSSEWPEVSRLLLRGSQNVSAVGRMQTDAR